MFGPRTPLLYELVLQSGVAQRMACAFNFGSPRPFSPLPDSSSPAVWVCHFGETKPSVTAVAGAHAGRWNSDPLRVPPEIGQFSHDSGGGALFESPFGFVHSGGGGSSDACDVLQKEPFRTAIAGDAQDLEEKP
jgi:hypothetical protein